MDEAVVAAWERPPVVLTAEDLGNQYIEEMEAARKAKESGIPRGPRTGIRGLDNMFGGYLPPGLYLMHGTPGVGKSVLASQMSTDCGFPAVYVSAEMSPLELMKRHVARASKTSKPQLLRGRLDPEDEIARLRWAISEAPDWFVMDGLSNPVHPDWIVDEVNKIRLFRETEHVLVIIDALHPWARRLAAAGSDIGKKTSVDILNEALDTMTRLANEEHIPVIMLAHRNRASMKEGGLSAVKGTSDAEHIADVVIDLHLEDQKQQNDLQRITIASAPKNRFGITGAQVRLMFDSDKQSFHELDLYR